eukprot:4078942-Pleurochrysis_carterae.AAC.1
MDSLVDLRMKPGAFGQRCARCGLARRQTVVIGVTVCVFAVRLPVRLFKDSVIVHVVRFHVVVGMVARLRLHRGGGAAVNRSVGFAR